MRTYRLAWNKKQGHEAEDPHHDASTALHGQDFKEKKGKQTHNKLNISSVARLLSDKYWIKQLCGKSDCSAKATETSEWQLYLSQTAQTKLVFI